MSLAAAAPLLRVDGLSVDIRTEDIVLSAMDRVTAGRTAFIITHRPSALKYCNLILRLENGRLSIVSPDASAPAVAVA